jgi:predicted ArsR family transcriptional regulator
MPGARESDDVGRLAVLDEPIRRRLFEYVRRGTEPVGREVAAEAVGIGRSLAAYHLDKLVEQGLLTATYRRPEGRGGPGAGRPAKLYTAAKGEVSVSVPARDYEFVARLLAESAEADPSGESEAARRAVAMRAGAQLASDLGGPSQHASLVDVLATRGYEPFTDEAGDVRLRNCPFHRLAVDHRDVVCGINHALIEGLLEALEREDVTASLEPESGRCCVVIRAREEP